MFCAAQAGKRGRRTLLIEQQDRVGKKILISGGGRCNFTNIHAGPENYISGNPDFCRSALARFSPWDFISLVENHGIRYHEKKLGQQFCTNSSREIVEMLLAECDAAGVTIRCGCRVDEVRKTDRFELQTSSGGVSCDSLVVATGGLSFAKLGATDFGHRLARQFGLRVTELRPGLVPLTLGAKDLGVYGSLSGLSLPVETRVGGKAFREALLFTHRGISGPAVLQISSYWRGGEAIEVDLLPESDGLPESFTSLWPKRFAELWTERHVPTKPAAQYSRREREELECSIHRWSLAIAGTEGYPKAEVTLGGVDTSELSSKTMEARKVPGLYFVGEVVDVTGWLGGYNFQWAWASAHAAGLVV